MNASVSVPLSVPQELSVVDGIPQALLEASELSFHDETAKHPWGEKPPQNGVLLPGQVICPVFLREDGSPSLCDCPNTKALLSLQSHRCEQGKLCIVRVAVAPHQHGGRRRV